jgi:hypothetical protein
MRRLTELSKTTIGLVPQALNNSNLTGRYHTTTEGRRLRAWLFGGAMAATKTTKLELLQATDSAGTGAKAVTDGNGDPVAVTITANADVTVGTVDLTAVANTDVVTVNGVDFTKAAATSVSLRTFADAAGLVTCINNSVYGVAGVLASANGAVVTIVAEPAGGEVVTLDKTENAGTIVLATSESQAFIDLELGMLDFDNGFRWVAGKVTTTANSVVAVLFDHYDTRFTPAQQVGASSVV